MLSDRLWFLTELVPVSAWTIRVHLCAARIFQSCQIKFRMALRCMNFHLNFLQARAWGGDNRFNTCGEHWKKHKTLVILAGRYWNMCILILEFILGTNVNIYHFGLSAPLLVLHYLDTIPLQQRTNTLLKFLVYFLVYFRTLLCIPLLSLCFGYPCSPLTLLQLRHLLWCFIIYFMVISKDLSCSFRSGVQDFTLVYASLMHHYQSWDF